MQSDTNINTATEKYTKSFLEKLHSNKNLDVPFIMRGLHCAIEYHGDQMRKSGEPYVMHPIAVAEMMMDAGLDTNCIVAGLLHDTIEDTTLTLEEISQMFNPRVAQMVQRVTRIKDPMTGHKPTVEEKLLETYQHKDYESLLLKIYDRIHNMQTIDAMKPTKQKEIAEETIYGFLLYALECNNSYALEKALNELCHITITKSQNPSVLQRLYPKLFEHDAQSGDLSPLPVFVFPDSQNT